VISVHWHLSLVAISESGRVFIDDKGTKNPHGHFPSLIEGPETNIRRVLPEFVVDGLASPRASFQIGYIGSTRRSCTEDILEKLG